MKKIIIAIDGFSSTGKSTIAKGVAKKLGYIYVDTGAMYRAVTLLAIRKKLINNDLINENELLSELNNSTISFVYNPILATSEIHLNGENVEHQIRGIAVADKVSLVAKYGKIRQHLVSIQQEMGKNKGIVMDGRDIGIAVFPEAELKIFMIASEKIRAERRYKELIEKGENISLESVLQNLRQRDFMDSTREESPLQKAPDAIEIDNSHTTINDLIEQIVNLAKDKMK